MSASTEKKLRQAAREAGTDKKMLAEIEAAKKKSQAKTRWTIGTIAVVILIAAIIFLDSGYLYKHTTALTVADETYTPAEMNYQYASQYLYWVNQYGSYASLFGLDTSSGIGGLGSQECSMTDGGTWKDYFLDAAVTQVVQVKALCDYAEAQGITLDDDELAEAESDTEYLETYASLQGYSSANNFLAANYGTGVTVDIANKSAINSSLANKAYNSYSDSLSYTADELEEKYESYEGEKDYFDIAYYYVAAETVEAEDGTSAATDETIAAAKDTADAVLAAYEANTEDTDYTTKLNAALAEVVGDAECTHNTNTQGSSLGNYKEWAMDDSRVAGDATVVESSNNDAYYVVVFISRNDNHYNLAQVRHILIKAEADEDGVYTDEAKEAAKAKAEEIYAEWQAGDATEESFAELANEYSEDTGSNTNGGLYDSVQKNQMVTEFDEFCFGGHKSGDTAIVYGESSSYAGYHIMYYVGEGEQCSDYLAESDLRSEDVESWIEDLTAGYEAVKGFWFKLVG